MHAHAVSAVPAPKSLKPVSSIRPGQHFLRLDSPNEVLVLVSFAGMEAADSLFLWAVVVATNHDSAGYVPGQLLKIARNTHVRPVHEVRPAAYAREQ